MNEANVRMKSRLSKELTAAHKTNKKAGRRGKKGCPEANKFCCAAGRTHPKQGFASWPQRAKEPGPPRQR